MYEYLFWTIYYLSPKTVRSIIHYIFSPLRRSFFKYFFEKGSNMNTPAQKIIQIQNVPQCSAANNECFILLDIHYLIQQTNNLEFFCMRIPFYLFSSFFVLKTLKKYNFCFGFSQDFYSQFDNGPGQSLKSPKKKHSMEIIDFVASLRYHCTVDF